MSRLDVPAAGIGRPARGGPRGVDRLLAADRVALAWWAASRVSTYLAAFAATYLFVGSGQHLVGFFDAWLRWDVTHYVEIARSGYVDPTGDTPLVAFFPGLPAALRAVHALGPSYAAAGLLVSAVAGAVAVVALRRLGDLRGPAGTGTAAVAALVVAPSAVFLAAGYTEALFLGFAIPAWLAARRERWLLAGLLGAGAACVRVSGLFLFAGLVVLFATEGGWPAVRARLRFTWILALPLVPVAAYAAWLKATRGDWLAWWHAQQVGWYRHLTDPVSSFRATWSAAFGGTQPVEVSLVFRLELLAGVVGVVVTVLLLVLRRWGEAAYVGTQLVALMTSTWWISVARASLLWFPLWLLLGEAAARRRWVLPAWVAVSAPFAVLLTAAFATGRWAG